MTEEQIKQIEEKLETLRTMIKKAASNGNYPSVNRTKSKIVYTLIKIGDKEI